MSRTKLGSSAASQHEQRDPVGALRTRTGDQQRSQARDLLVHCGDRTHQVVTTGRDTAKTEPRVACNQALEVLGRHDIQAVLANDGA